MKRGGLCEACMSPGACCRSLRLSDGEGEISVWDDRDVVEQLRERLHAADGMPMPFMPLQKMWTATAPDGHVEAGATYSGYRWTCTALDDRTGRCTIYESRPRLCRDYVPGSDPLCVHFVAPTEPPNSESGS